MPKFTPEKKAEHTTVMRQAIMRTFTDMFAADGSVSMEHLAEKLGVSKGTLYNYFPDKEKLIAAVMDARQDEMLNRIHAEIAEDAPADIQLTGLARIMFEDFLRYRYLRIEFLRTNPLGKSSPPVDTLACFRKVLECGIQQGLFRPLDTEKSSVFLFCALVGKFRFLLKNGGQVHIEEELELFRNMVLPALKNVSAGKEPHS